MGRSQKGPGRGKPAPASSPAPPRVRAPPVPRETLTPFRDRQLWTCRAGFEAHLFEELAWAGAHPRLLGPALVESDPRRGLAPVFGRMGFRVEEAIAGEGDGPLAARIARLLDRSARGRP